MVEICCYAAPIAMEITSESLDPHRVFQHPQAKSLIEHSGQKEAYLSDPQSDPQNQQSSMTYVVLGVPHGLVSR
jgi:hypothetical protein